MESHTSSKAGTREGVYSFKGINLILIDEDNKYYIIFGEKDNEFDYILNLKSVTENTVLVHKCSTGTTFL